MEQQKPDTDNVQEEIDKTDRASSSILEDLQVVAEWSVSRVPFTTMYVYKNLNAEIRSLTTTD